MQTPRLTIAIALALGFQGPAASTPRIGVAAADSNQRCLALSGPAIPAGAEISLVTPDAPQQVSRAIITRPLGDCDLLTKHLIEGPYYELEAASRAQPLPPLALAVLGRPRVRSAGPEVRLELNPRLRDVRVRSCASSEGLHLTVWSGRPLTSARLWHAYWYLGIDVEPNCRPKDYEPVR